MPPETETVVAPSQVLEQVASKLDATEIAIEVGLLTTTTVSSLHKLGSVTVIVYDPAHNPLAVDAVLITLEVALFTQEN